MTGRVGSTWQFAPQFGSTLSFAEGGFTTLLGKFSAKWTRTNSSSSGGGGYSYTASVNTPPGTVGQFILPVVEQGVLPTVLVDGVPAGNVTWARKTGGVVFDTVLVGGVGGGNHTVVVH